MSILLWFTLLAVSLAAARDTAAQPRAGSQLPAKENRCASCHDEADRWQGDQLRLYVPLQELADDAHWRSGVNCHDCHGGNPHVAEDLKAAHAESNDDPQAEWSPFQRDPDEVRKSCVRCHEEPKRALDSGVHGGPVTGIAEDGQTLPSNCHDCHGERAHGIYPVRDLRSPVFAEHQVRLCGSCHAKALADYRASVHGHGLEHSGLLVSAVCTDCHGGHDMHAAADPRSTLHPANVVQTCGRCHLFIADKLQQSVHGQQHDGSRRSQAVAPDGQITRTASCIDCHQGHDLPHPHSNVFQLTQADRCGSCHAIPTSRYAISVHGQLTELGYLPAAKCSDCHGSHEIRALSDPQSRLSSLNRQATCGNCHVGAVANFLDFDPHADPTDSERSPALFRAYVGLVALLVTVFAVFGTHSLAWFCRSLIDVLKNGRPARLVPGEIAYVRFKPAQRAAHTVMMVSFLGLALTGLPLKYSDREWAHRISRALGGFESTGLWHRIFGVVNVGCLVFFCVWIVVRLIAGPRRGGSRGRMLFGGDSPLPNRRDLRDLAATLRWFVGRGPKPTFEHWTYWEKFDLWAAAGDIVIIGLTGLILWFPNFFCRVLPGEALNFAILVHARQALLATGFVFAIHFFSTHLRPEKFPMDMSVLTGVVSEHELREERQDYYERLRDEGRLDELRTTVPSRRYCQVMFVIGAVALLIGWALLAGIVRGLLT